MSFMVTIRSTMTKLLGRGSFSRTTRRPFHGEQYIALTTKSWTDDLIGVPERSWIHGGTPDESRIVPWGIQSIDHEDIDFW